MSEPIVIPTFYEYLKDQGLGMDKLSDQAMDTIRKDYSRFRNRMYKKRQRESKRELTLFLDRNEHKILKVAAHYHHLVLSHYVKQAALKYTEGTYITPDATTLKLVLYELEEVTRGIDAALSRKRGLFSKDFAAQELSKVIETLKNGLISSVCSPVNVEKWISEEISRNPAFKHKLIALLLSHV